jgi:diadenosine tetraphosphatase ApaH/serine/threonine PP2A family protein phosphatase
VRLDNRRVVVCGDVHGCLEELKELLRTIEYHPEWDRLVFLGDLVDRGPDSPGVVRYVRSELKAECVKGNHDEKPPRWCRYQANEKLTGKPNPMKNPGAARVAEWEALTEEDLKWLDRLPWTIDLAPGWVAVHAGFEPTRSLSQQRGDRMCHVRYVDCATGDMVQTPPDEEIPSHAVLWTLWSGAQLNATWEAPMNAVYGHNVHDLQVPRVDRNNNGRSTFYGIDTGCCFGGRLTAWMYKPAGSIEVASVPAKMVYTPLITRTE